MRYAIFALAFVVWFVDASNAGSPHASLPSPRVPEGLGVNIHFTDAQPGELEMLSAAGFRWIRMDFHWAATEKAPGQYDFAAYDRLLASLEEHKLRALFILDYSNPLYEKDASVATDAGRQAYSKWAAAAAKHFQGHGILWEIWNEPNGVFWKPKQDVGQYAALALAASKAIHAAAPGEAVIGPATSTIDFKFLEACFTAGVLEHWDAVSVHPYRPTAPETVVPEYERLRSLIDHYAPKGKNIPILSGEWGYSSGWKKFDEEHQGRLLARQWLVNLANGIPLSIWYDWHDDGQDANEPEHHFGTVANAYHAGRAQVYDPKPAYLAAKTLTATFSGCEFDRRLHLEEVEDYALAFRRGGEVRLAVWSTAAAPHTVKIPGLSGKFSVLTHLGERRDAIEADQSGLQVTISDLPIYLIPAP